MKLRFNAQKMIDRCISEGNGHLLDEATVGFIRSMDGMEADTYCWSNYVNDEPVALVNVNGGTYVNIADCD